MKKIVLVFAFTLLLFYDTSSQNIIETYRWINATFLEMMVSNKCEYTKFSIQLYQDTVTHEITSIGVDIAYKTEKDTIYIGVKMPLNNIIVYEMPPNDNCYFIGFCPKSGTFRGGAIHNKNNYEIIKEDLCLDEGIYYELFKVRSADSQSTELDSIYYEVSPILLRSKNPLMKDFLQNKNCRGKAEALSGSFYFY